MDLTPRETAFILDEMSEVENSEHRYPSAKREAGQIRKKAEKALTE